MPALFTVSVDSLTRRDDGDVNFVTTPASTAASNPINLGHGASSADSFNNAVILITFAIIAALMVLATFWFFAVSPRGGFRWKKTDWEDYKSTVLRRKGPDGKTLSNATKSTRLGQPSEAPQFSDRGDGQSEIDGRGMNQVSKGYKSHLRGGASESHRSSHRDPELAAYKHERPAKVGGLNTASAGSHYDYTNTEPSVYSGGPITRRTEKEAKKAAREAEKREKQRQKDAIKAEKKARKDIKAAAKLASKNREMQQKQQHRGHPSAAYSFTTGDDTASFYTDTNTYSDYTSMTAPAHKDQTNRRAHPPSSEAGQSYHYDNYRPNQPLNAISEVSSAQSASREAQLLKQQQQHRETPPSRYRRMGTDSPSHDENRHRSASQNSPSPTKPHRSSHGYTAVPAPAHQSPSHNNRSSPNQQYSYSDYNQSQSQGGSDETGTKVYPCFIPGISGTRSSGPAMSDNGLLPSDSVSQIGVKSYARAGGYRRAGGRSRDELAEEDEED